MYNIYFTSFYHVIFYRINTSSFDNFVTNIFITVTSLSSCVTYENAIPNIHYQVYILTQEDKSETSLILTNLDNLLIFTNFTNLYIFYKSINFSQFSPFPSLYNEKAHVWDSQPPGVKHNIFQAFQVETNCFDISTLKGR